MAPGAWRGLNPGGPGRSRSSAIRVEGPQQGRRPERAVLAWPGGQPVGDQPQRSWVDAEAEMTTADLDVLVPFGLGFHTGLPGHDAVQARVHRGRRDPDGP